MGLSPRGYPTDWTIPLCRGFGGIEHNIVFVGASAQGAVSWVAPGATSRVPSTSECRFNKSPHHQACRLVPPPFPCRINTKSKHQETPCRINAKSKHQSPHTALLVAFPLSSLYLSAFAQLSNKRLSLTHTAYEFQEGGVGGMKRTAHFALSLLSPPPQALLVAVLLESLSFSAFAHPINERLSLSL
jgi:hypothetical protein